jgi:hypothetical protein
MSDDTGSPLAVPLVAWFWAQALASASVAAYKIEHRFMLPPLWCEFERTR